MDQEKEKFEGNVYFVELVSALAGSAMQQLGKIANVMTGKVETDIEGAKRTIEMLDMLKEKTKGNLSKDENNMILSILTNLQLNYVDESEKKDKPKTEEIKEKPEEKPKEKN
ncbi:DUF1844 domain-containing protein [Candidatus Auribacterota bacterium]